MMLENREAPAWVPPRHPLPNTSHSLSLCGPTVYDASHLGHARNYVTTDILRRIMRDYFGYEVIFVQNVTDVDDKIIRRAREQYFFTRYKADHPKVDQKVLEDTVLAYSEYGRGTVGFPSNLPIHEFRTWMDHERSIIDHSALKDEMQIIFQNRITTLQRAVIAWESARSTPIDAAGYYSSVEGILSSYLGHEVRHKISAEDHSIFSDFAAHWESQFNDDLRALNCLPPTITTRVSEFIPDNIEFVAKIIDNGFAYVIPGGTVYFDVTAFENAGHFYAKLEPGNRENDPKEQIRKTTSSVDKPLTPEELEIQQEKAKPPRLCSLEEESRRPGWHIECSAMASKVLGSRIDIHSGGIDLAFPHHDNELAQSEAYWYPDGNADDVQWINYFLHMGHLSIEGSKMSKSLKNFVTIREALSGGYWTSRKLRLLFMMSGWKGGLEISSKAQTEVATWERTVNNFFAHVSALILEARVPNSRHQKHLFRSQERQLFEELENAQKSMHAVLSDSFNTALGLSAISDLITKANTYLKVNQISVNNPDSYFSLTAVEEIARWITRMLEIFGLSDRVGGETIGWSAVPMTDSASGKGGETSILPYVRLLSTFRDQVKHLAISNIASPISQRLLQLTDDLRDIQLLPLGISLEDRDSSVGEAALMKFGIPADLMAAKEAKAQQLADRDVKKEAARAAAAKVEREKAGKAKMSPQDMFRTNEYSEWDEDGVPTKDKEGNELTKSKRKTLKKAWERQDKLHSAFIPPQLGSLI
ncbi:Cysteine--tRNA ligase [Hypsizygus marmoreus]|uniref:Cysteine--tRNA ligase n=1 Tax=Hypsizygus marmoreus TaxID=39966 RepID=A0A369K8B1_HYPMA|nr:Cysteine--tRNA ligase [Hypsizygus marmoreus]